MSMWARTDLYGLKWNVGCHLGKEKKGWDGQQVSASGVLGTPSCPGLCCKGGFAELCRDAASKPCQ